jgi:hypothetical protein
VKPREGRRREAWYRGLGTLGAVAGLLLLYELCEGMPAAEGGALGPWIGASIGAAMTYLPTRRQRREEEARQRRTLATMLLQELRLLEIVLKDINDSFELDMEEVEPFHTAMYDQAGPELLRLTPTTVDQLAYFYQLIHTLQMQLNWFRHHPPGSRAWHDAALKVRATQAALLIKDVARLLVAEGGIRPRPFPH